MDELEELPTIIESSLLVHTPAVVEPISNTKKRKTPEKKTKSKKADLIKRYLNNFDASKEKPPTDEEIKSMSVVKLETL